MYSRAGGQFEKEMKDERKEKKSKSTHHLEPSLEGPHCVLPHGLHKVQGLWILLELQVEELFTVRGGTLGWEKEPPKD